MHEYRKVMNRALPLFSCQYWYNGEYEELGKTLSGASYFKPLFIYRTGEGVSIFYDYTDPKQDPNIIAEYYNKNHTEFYKVAEKYQSDINIVTSLVDELKFDDIKKIFDNVVSMWAGLTTMNVLGGQLADVVDEELSKEAYRLRSMNDRVIYTAGLKMREVVMDNLPIDIKDFVDFLLLDEILNREYPTIDDLKKRRNGYLFYNSQLYMDDINKVLTEHNINLVEEKDLNNKMEIKGQVAFKGKITGKVSVLFELNQIEKVKDGDILVTAMTTPDFISAMKKASAFVTDEGGITCHAAIVARELKKPCIIGTKIATKVLKDVDMVEVDAEKGIVRKMS